MNKPISRDELIRHGMAVLQAAGAYYVCDVCIKNGNSCCYDCSHLEDGVGCQKRNTACTAWLCGIQKFLLQNIGLMNQWERFWSQVPGRYFREDETPDTVKITRLLDINDIDDTAGRLLAKKLEAYVQKGGNLGKVERYLNTKYILAKFTNSTQDDKRGRSM